MSDLPPEHPTQTRTPPADSTSLPAGFTASASRLSLRPLAALAAAALLGGGAALAGAYVLGGIDGSTTTVFDQQAAPVGGGSAVPASASSGLTVNQIYRRSGPGVVQITSSSPGASGTDAFGQQFQQPAQQALGSGFVLDKVGHIVTNYHVIQGATEIEVRFSNDDTLKATVVGSDPSTDIALLKVNASSRALTPLPLGNSDRAQVGDAVVAIGNPFGLERTVTSGIVSALQRAVVAPNGFTIDHVIQTDAPINHGNSGGPLLNLRGEVIGVNSQIETGGSGDGNVGIGFAVPSNTVKSVIAQLLAHGKVEHAYLGVAATPITPELARTFRLPVDSGLMVERVTAGSGAAKARIRAGGEQVVVAGESYRLGGDVIVGADDTRVTSIGDLRDVVAAHKPGDTIDLKIYRDGKPKTVSVTLGRQPTSPSQ